MSKVPAKAPFSKQEVVEHIQAHLAEQLKIILESAQTAAADATGEESRAENQYDTRGLEASYLASAQAQRAAEIQKLLTVYKFLPLREYGPNDVVCPTTLLGLEHNGTVSYAFIVPAGGGLVAQIQGHPVQILTAQSPLGDALLGRKLGDRVDVEIRGQTREYLIVSLN